MTTRFTADAEPQRFYRFVKAKRFGIDPVHL